MRYDVRYTREANIDLAKLEKSEPKAFKKATCLIEELRTHPKTGLGHPEPLRGGRSGQWSRQITKKHRLVYRIYDTEVVVLVLTAYGHYDDK